MLDARGHGLGFPLLSPLAALSPLASHLLLPPLVSRIRALAQVGEGGLRVQYYDDAKQDERLFEEVNETTPLCIVEMSTQESLSNFLFNNSKPVPGTGFHSDLPLPDLQMVPFAIFDPSGMGTVEATHWPLACVLGKLPVGGAVPPLAVLSQVRSKDGELVAALVALFGSKPVMRGKLLNAQSTQCVKWTRRGRKQIQMWTDFMRPAMTQASSNQTKLVLADGDFCFCEVPIKATSFLMQLQAFPGQTSSTPVEKLKDLFGVKNVLKLDQLVRQATIFSDFRLANVVPIDGTPSFLEYLCSENCSEVDSTGGGTVGGTSISHRIINWAEYADTRGDEASAALLARSAALAVQKAYMRLTAMNDR